MIDSLEHDIAPGEPRCFMFLLLSSSSPLLHCSICSLAGLCQISPSFKSFYSTKKRQHRSWFFSFTNLYRCLTRSRLWTSNIPLDTGRMSSMLARRRSPTIEKRRAHKLASVAKKEVECVDKLVLNYWEVKYLFTKLNSFFSSYKTTITHRVSKYTCSRSIYRRAISETIASYGRTLRRPRRQWTLGSIVLNFQIKLVRDCQLCPVLEFVQP